MRRAIPLLIIAGLGAPAQAQAPAAVTKAPATKPTPVIRATRETPPLFDAGVSSLLFTDGGRCLLVAGGAQLALMDLETLAVVGKPTTLASERAPSPWPKPHDDERYRDLSAAFWAWNARTRTITGAVTVDTRSRIAEGGPSVWTPARQRIPVPLRFDRAFASRAEPIAISPDGSIAYARLSRDSAVGVQAFDARTGDPIGKALATPYVGAAVSSPDGQRVALAATYAVLVLTPATGVITTLEGGHREEIRHLAFHPSLPILASAGDDGVRVWNLGDASPSPRTVGKRGGPISFSPDGKYLVIAGSSNAALLDASTFAPVGGPLVDDAERRSIDAAAFSPDGRHLVLVRDRNALTILDLAPPLAAPPPVDVAWYGRLQRMSTPDPDVPPPIARDGTFRGQVTAKGKPLAGVEIRLHPSTQEWPNARALPDVVVRTGKDGRFAFASLPRIDWGVSVVAAHWQRTGMLLKMRETPGHQHDVGLEPAATIEGRVTGPDGRPAAGATVTVAEGWGGSPARPSIVTGRDGRFVVDHLRPPVKPRLWVRAKDGSVAMAEVAFEQPTTKQVLLRLRAAEAPGVLRVLVVTADGKPAAGVHVSVDSAVEDVTDASGRYTFAIAEAEGRHRVTACAHFNEISAWACGDASTDASPFVLVRLPAPSP